MRPDDTIWASSQMYCHLVSFQFPQICLHPCSRRRKLLQNIVQPLFYFLPFQNVSDLLRRTFHAARWLTSGMVCLRSRGVFTVLKNLLTDAKNTPLWTDPRIFLRLTSAPLLHLRFFSDFLLKDPEHCLCLSRWSSCSCTGLCLASVPLSIHFLMDYLYSQGKKNQLAICFFLHLALNNSP